MILLHAFIRPLLTVTAATLGSLTFTSLIDCQPSLFLWDLWNRNHSKGVVSDFYKDKNVWIIGASSGIGKEMACQLARAGCSNLILSARNQDSIAKVAQKCQQESSSKCRCHCQVLDVVSLKGADDLAARFEDILQNQLPPIPIDIVVFNSGAGQLEPSLKTKPITIQRIMDVNALWPMVLTPLLYKYNVFRPSTRPHLAVTNSIAAQLPVPLSSVYAASKAAQAQYFASLAAEQPENSLRVDVLCPGPVETDFHQNHLKDSNNLKGRTEANTNQEKKNRSKTKMSVERCAHLMVAAMAKRRRDAHQEIWIAPSPMISVLYLQRLFPGLFQRLTTKFGQKRVSLWKAGKDLYDPDSWK